MRTYFLIFALFISCTLRSQIKADGYLGVMPGWYHMEQLDQDLRETTIHNRINLSYDFSPTVIGVVQFRNRLIHGQTVDEIPGYSALIDSDQGFLDMSYNLASDESAILNLTVDRLWLDFYLGKLQVRAGRQRISWGQAMVWNPNDIFNAYSFFNPDYPERPGIDGIRLQLFVGPASQIDGVFKINTDHQKTMAMRFRFNAGRYDWQILSGRLNDQDWTAGLGWSGHIGNAGFYGESTFLIPDHGEEIIIVSTGMNYTFRNSLLWQSEFLYSSNLSNTINGFSNFIIGQASIKNLSVTRYTIFSSLQYPFTPLFSGTLNAMHFVGTNGWYAGPSLEYSIQRNLYLSAFLNLFLNKTAQNGNTMDYLGAVRLKWFF